MKQYIYRGENPREFELAFLKNVGLDSVSFRGSDGTEGIPGDYPTDDPFGVIIIPKDFEDCWLADLHFYMDWKVVVASAPRQFVKGYNDDRRWILLRDSHLKKLSDFAYQIYRDPDGRVIAETMCAGEYPLADSVEEFERMSEDELESVIYGCEMGRAR